MQMARKKLVAETVAETAVFDRAGFTPEAGKHYRVHFRNGNSGEYNGQALDSGAPFPWEQVSTVEEIVQPEPLKEGGGDGDAHS